MFLSNLATLLSFENKPSTPSYQSRIYHKNNSPIRHQHFSTTMILFILLHLLASGKIANKSTTSLPTFQNAESLYYISLLSSDFMDTHEYVWKFCINMSGELLSIETQFELNDINYHLEPIACHPIWTAGRIDIDTKTWKWPRGDDIHNWCPGYPKPVLKNLDFNAQISNACAAISCDEARNWCLVNIHCNRVLPFICEKYSFPYNVNPTTFESDVGVRPKLKKQDGGVDIIIPEPRGRGSFDRYAWSYTLGSTPDLSKSPFNIDPIVEEIEDLLRKFGWLS